VILRVGDRLDHQAQALLELGTEIHREFMPRNEASG
jgi:hypothetical protein